MSTSSLKYSIALIFLWLLSAGNDVKSQCTACQYAVDLIDNGDFTNGNSGFTSSLSFANGPIFTCPLCPENTYAIGASAVLYHSGFNGSDHTNPPFGDFFIANGPGQSGALVWCQSLTVQPNTDYTFTFWGRDVTNNNNVHPVALLQASFNGILFADTLEADGGWEQYTATWNSGSETTLDLCIVNQQSNTGGNDFGLDDIQFVGCQDYHLSQPAFAGNDMILCSNASAQLGQPSIPGYTYTWENNSGLSSLSIADPDVSMTNTGADTLSQMYVVTRDSANVGCIASDTVWVQILAAPLLDLGPDISICPMSSTSLDAGSTWENILWSTNENSQTITVSPGDYSVEVTYNSCVYSDEISVNEIPLPVIDLGPDQTICRSQPLVLDAGITGQWSDNSIADTLDIQETGVYYFTYTDQDCTTSDTVNVTVLEYPVVYLPQDTLSCSGTEVTLDAGISGLWSTGALGSSIVVNQSGYYDIVVANGQCQTNVGTTVTLSPLPFVDLGEDLYICEDNDASLNAFEDFNDQYVWSTGDSIATISVHGAGVYSVTVTNECGSDTDEIAIDTYPCSYAIYVPSCFTPNDDNINESWMVQGYNVSNLQIRVYNKFGDMIFFAEDFGIPWYPSTGIKDDVYDYRIQATTYDGDDIVQLGRIYLLR